MNTGIIENPNLVVDFGIRRLCVKPYQGHKRGCPNWNKKDGCPPGAQPLGNVIDLSRMVAIAWSRFDLDAHVRRMHDLHPVWTKRQLECCLYWQPRARKALRTHVDALLGRFPAGMVALYCPEAHGLNVTATMAGHGIVLEWPPVKFVYQVALLGYPAT